MTDQELIVEMLHNFEEKLSDTEVEAFTSMGSRLQRGYNLTDKQRAWVRSTAERLKLYAQPAQNLFSTLPPEVQREHRRRARAVELPWEKPGAQKALKPPGRRV